MHKVLYIHICTLKYANVCMYGFDTQGIPGKVDSTINSISVIILFPLDNCYSVYLIFYIATPKVIRIWIKVRILKFSFNYRTSGISSTTSFHGQNFQYISFIFPQNCWYLNTLLFPFLSLTLPRQPPHQCLFIFKSFL